MNLKGRFKSGNENNLYSGGREKTIGYFQLLQS
jgi:hypothetical protein